jgi:hypothetical protein
MKRNIVINSSRTALVISDNLSDAVSMVHKDTNVGDEIFAFDTSLHIAYAYEVVRNGYKVVEVQVPIKQFRNFSIHGNSHEIYMYLISTFLS